MMNYDPQKPIAVFLGPTLENAYARQRLAANYYPPARMGDIYRLLGSGVRLVVLIDGIFHSTASLWQRELLEALENDIMVVGASSMGALRAAELHQFVMIGYGTVFEWYRDGVIEGDDEVALNHADELHGYRAFSEPLVNIRYNLLRAVRQNYVSQEQATALIEYARKTYYADRSYTFLLNSPVVKQWPQKVQQRLAHFIRQHAVNLKKEDAIDALKYCATALKAGDGVEALAGPPPKGSTSYVPDTTIGSITEKISTNGSRCLKSQDRYYRLVAYRHRGFLTAAGDLVSGEMLLVEALKEVGSVKGLRSVLIKNFFLLLWAGQRQINCPADYFEAYQESWKVDQIHIDLDHWLQANGLTRQEFRTILVEQALLSWLVERGPSCFGLDFEPYGRLLENSLLAADQPPSILKEAAEICYLAAWARENGVVCPSIEVEKFIQRWEEIHQISDRAAWLEDTKLSEMAYLAVLAEWAGVAWLIEKGPAYFGYTSWSFEAALLKELQITGRAAKIVEKIKVNGIAHPCL